MRSSDKLSVSATLFWCLAAPRWRRTNSALSRPNLNKSRPAAPVRHHRDLAAWTGPKNPFQFSPPPGFHADSDVADSI